MGPHSDGWDDIKDAEFSPSGSQPVGTTFSMLLNNVRSFIACYSVHLFVLQVY